MDLRKLIEWNGDSIDIEKFVLQLGPRDTCLYLFAVGFEKFLSRVRKDPKEISKELNTTVAAVSAWKTGKNFPSFDKIVELIKLGMTLEEIFGERLAKVIEENSGFSGRVAELEKTIESQRKQIELLENVKATTTPPPEFMNDPEFLAGLKKGASAGDPVERLVVLEKELAELKGVFLKSNGKQ